MDVNKKVELLINYRSCSDDTSFDEEYQSTFGGEGVRKSKYIFNALSTNREASEENLSEYIFVSIGGADGSEAEEILKNTDIKKSIMVEISDHASEIARERALDLKNTLEKELVIIQGDVTQKLPDVIKRMKEFKVNDGLTGLILSIQAVIHELPRRSPNFRKGVFFGQLFDVFSKNIFFCREPIKPERWPDIVEVKVGNASSKNLAKLAEIINDKLSITDLPVTPIANGFINVDSKLAIELLHKLLRPRNVSQFEYELGEQLTTLDPNILKKKIESHLGKATVTIESTTTEGFKEAWKRYEVAVKNEEGDLLSYPNTHARLVGFALTSEHTPSNTKRGHNKSSLRLQKKEIESNKIKIVAKKTETRGLQNTHFETINAFFSCGFAEEDKNLIDFFKSICRSCGIEPIMVGVSEKPDAGKARATLKEVNCLVVILTHSVISDKMTIAWSNQLIGMAFANNLPVSVLIEQSITDKDLNLIPNVIEPIRFRASKFPEVIADLLSFFYYVKALITGQSIQYINEKKDVKSKLERYADMYDSRLYINYPAKQNIAHCIIKNFISNRTRGIILDSGTVNYVIADALVESGFRIPIVTNNLAIVNKLKDILNYPVFVLPGEFDSRTDALGGQSTGEMARKFLKGEKDIKIDIAFLAANSIEINRGLSADAPMFSDFRAAILRHASKVVLVLQGEKFLKNVSDPVIPMEEWIELLERRKKDSSIYFVVHKLAENYGFEAMHSYSNCIYQLQDRFPISHVIEISD